MNRTKKLRLYFSYNQFMVFDSSVELPGCAWTKLHSDQGFARRDSVVNFETVLEFGHADVGIRIGAYEHNSVHERVIAVPFHVESGLVRIEGPEENPSDRRIPITAGHYRLYCAQQVTNDDDLHGEERIDLFFEPLEHPAEHSEIIVADADLHPPAQLVEDAEIAGQ